ncbi:MAG TPA: hypothetical protein PLV95_00435 [Candidatus Pacearchaeota archaeon]|nr:hypothetical protein [Candidatus Pacearchaeota archaeon]
MTLNFLRKKYPVFYYESYSFKQTKGGLLVSFVFKTGDIIFHPKVLIKKAKLKKGIDNLVFNLGLIEMFSYWKAVCSPKIVVKCGRLDAFQKKWWKELLIKGMGQFFYENRIDFTKKGFIEIESIKKGKTGRAKNFIKGRQVLIPLGGGKDSAVVLDLFSQEKKTACFSLNPNQRIKQMAKIGHCKEFIVVEREIDKKLLQLNRKGFLNGHTPFVAYLSFLSVLLAVLFNKKYVVFGNEDSANEGNVNYLGKEINHQYSKTIDFEKKFKDYSQKYLAKDVNVFSILRPFYELQIGKIFSSLKQYFPVFLSCNEANKTCSGTKKKTEEWCGHCPKCLFVFMILYPFVEEKELIKIFRFNLLDKKELLPLLKELIGEKKVKPFECVGTRKESLVALYLGWKKNQGRKQPFLLSYFEKNKSKSIDWEKEEKNIMTHWNKNNFVPKEFL